jgi:superfamily II DNA or RNA helicase
MTERRRFNVRERTALYLAADGRCSECGAELEPGWHGDHVNPWSRGGRTDVINGQALCPACNLKKGNTVELRDWQRDALDDFLTSPSDDFLVVAVPGAGKTRLSLAAALALIDQAKVERIIVVVPTSHLRAQWAAHAAAVGIDLDSRFENGAGALARDFRGVAVTYAAVASMPMLYRKLTADRRTLVILDEVHHGGDQLAWGEALRTAFGEATRRLLLSGTPDRTDGCPVPFVRYDAGRQFIADYSYDYGQALQDGSVVRPIEFLALSGNVRWRYAGAVTAVDLTKVDDDTRKNALMAAYDPDGDWIASVLRKANEELSRHRMEVPDAGGLVIAADQFHARAYAKLLERISGEAPTLAISDEADSSQRIAAFATARTRWIVAVQMVSEGVDIPRLVVGVYASRISTKLFFRQVVGRFVRMRSVEDEATASLFIPSISPLLGYAQQIETTIGEALAEQQEKVAREVKEYEQTTLSFDLVEPMGSSEAVHHSTILGGDSFGDEELRRAEVAGQASGMPASVSVAQLARFLRAAGAGRIVGTGVVKVPAQPKPLAEEKATLRWLIKRKVGRLANITALQHGHIHAELNRALGDTASTATAETLTRRLELLDQWIQERS